MLLIYGPKTADASYGSHLAHVLNRFAANSVVRGVGLWERKVYSDDVFSYGSYGFLFESEHLGML